MKKLLVTSVLILLAVLMNAQATVKTIPVTTSSKKALSLYNEAMNAYQDVDINKYMDLTSKAIAEDPDFFMAYYQKAIFAAYLNQEKNFIKEATSAVNCKSRISSGEKILKDATKLLLEDRKADLRSYGKKLVEMYPQDVNSYIQLMAYQYIIKDYDGQISTLNEALKLQGRKDYLYNVLAYAHMEKGQFREAEEALDKYISLSPNLPNPYDSKGDLYMRTKEYAKAYDNFMKANSIDTSWSKGKILMADKLAQAELMKKFVGTWQSGNGKDTINLVEFNEYNNAVLQINSRIIKGVKRIQVTSTYTYDPVYKNFKAYAVYPNGQAETWRLIFRSDRDVDFIRVEDLKTNTVMFRNTGTFDDPAHMTVNNYNKDNVRTGTSKWIKTNALTLDQQKFNRAIGSSWNFIGLSVKLAMEDGIKPYEFGKRVGQSVALSWGKQESNLTGLVKGWAGNCSLFQRAGDSAPEIRENTDGSVSIIADDNSVHDYFQGSNPIVQYNDFLEYWKGMLDVIAAHKGATLKMEHQDSLMVYTFMKQ